MNNKVEDFVKKTLETHKKDVTNIKKLKDLLFSIEGNEKEYLLIYEVTTNT